MKRASEAGYNLVILMVALTLLNILLALALPKWSHVIRREREEELISRGWQYAEAVRIYQNRFQQLPVRLEDLIEREPRSIRKLWKDPMTEDGKWALISEQQPPGPTVPPLDDKGRPKDDPEPGDDHDPSEEIDPGTGIGEKKGIVQIGPFIGVRSRSQKESILIFQGHNRYDEWQFTWQMLMQGGHPGPGGDPTNVADYSTRWLGRPLPSFLQIPPGGLPGPPERPPNTTGSRR
ncbi:MAG TPA: hypothetical protein VE078_11360 [Thermoanaerobaculia bacterium]|nr:hypothetical protein [Thermoanaerobaculia bacterium]